MMTSARIRPSPLTAAADTSIYGRKRAKEDDAQAQVLAHLQELKPAIQELARLECAVQRSYWQTKFRFAPS